MKNPFGDATLRPKVSIEEALSHLVDASKAVLSELEVDRLLEVLMDKVVELTRADRGFLMLSEDGETLGFRVGRGIDRAQVDGDEALISRSVAEEVFRTRQPIHSCDALGDDALRNRKSVLELRLSTVMCAPLLVQSRALGVLYVDSSRIRTTFDATGLAVFQALADLAAIALENARLYQLATTDARTGLANSGFFRSRLETAFAAAKPRGHSLGVVLVDLDHFKRVNDTWGHPAGDLVLREVAAILRRSVRGSDLAARYGGEEFVLLVAPVGASDEARSAPVAIAERVRRAIAEHGFRLADGTEIRVTASLGVAVLSEVCAQSCDDLVEAADKALYEAKHGGRDRVVEAAGALALAAH